MNWEIALGDLPRLPQRTVLQVLRITQESLNNALRHSGAENIWVRARVNKTPAELQLKLSDDGTGNPEKFTSRQGLQNMQQRAHAIGAKLYIDREQNRMQVSMILPLV